MQRVLIQSGNMFADMSSTIFISLVSLLFVVVVSKSNVVVIRRCSRGCQDFPDTTVRVASLASPTPFC
jgi:hypothetical protein